jgi:hypothetical protein
MDIQAIIDELDKQAAHYREAANALQNLGSGQGNGAQTEEIPAVTSPQARKGKVGQSPKPAQTKLAQAKATQSKTVVSKAASTQQTVSKASTSPKRAMSPEARAKLSALMKARHQQRKNEQAKA